MIMVLNFRQKYTNACHTLLAFFVIYYFTINFWVNCFDLCWNHLFQGILYKHDEDFVYSFSYKVHLLVLISSLAFISSQFVRPSIPVLKEQPLLLTLMHLFSILVAGSLFFNFLFELTSMAP